MKIYRGGPRMTRLADEIWESRMVFNPPLSLRIAADRCGISHVYLWNIERGHCIPSLAVLCKLGEGLGIQRGVLLELWRREKIIHLQEKLDAEIRALR